ncbi:MAG: hypothetical protein KGM24_15410, partial [Elusimicrobia bacterium]|nr:hypothetical protein [Elusimicrobiota bacterium]
MLPAALAVLLAAGAPAAARPAPKAPTPERINRDLARVVDLFYDLDFDRAQKAADALETRYPGRPAGPFFRAAVSYQRWVAAGLPRAGWARVDAR